MASTIDEASAHAVFDAMSVDAAWIDATNWGYRMPLWPGRLVSSVLLAARGESVTYVTLGGEEAGRVWSLQGSAFTASRLISFEATGPSASEDVQWRVQFRALRALSAVDVRTDVQPFMSDGFSRWPGDPSALLRFEDGLEVRVPMGAGESDARRDARIQVLLNLP